MIADLGAGTALIATISIETNFKNELLETHLRTVADTGGIGLTLIIEAEDEAEDAESLETVDFRDFRDFPEPKGEASFGARIANGRPYRDPRGFDEGGKGGR